MKRFRGLTSEFAKPCLGYHANSSVRQGTISAAASKAANLAANPGVASSRNLWAARLKVISSDDLIRGLVSDSMPRSASSPTLTIHRCIRTVVFFTTSSEIRPANGKCRLAEWAMSPGNWEETARKQGAEMLTRVTLQEIDL